MHRSKSPETLFLTKRRAAVPEFGHFDKRSRVFGAIPNLALYRLTLDTTPSRESFRPAKNDPTQSWRVLIRRVRHNKVTRDIYRLES